MYKYKATGSSLTGLMRGLARGRGSGGRGGRENGWRRWTTTTTAAAHDVSIRQADWPRAVYSKFMNKNKNKNNHFSFTSYTLNSTKHWKQRPLHLPSTQISRFHSSAARMPTYPGSCYCRNITYDLSLSSPDEARTSLCHCSSCKKAFGTNYGLTAKVPKDALTLKSGQPKEFVGDNGSGSTIHREFCGNCGSFILEYGDAVKNDFRYICVGTLDDPEVLPPKGEFFCESRSNWMPEIPDVFHKQKIKE